MLIEYTVKNFASIHEEAHFSMVKGAGSELLESNVQHFPNAPVRLNSLLRSSAIYGANATGKTNFLRSLVALRSIVVGSSQRNPGDRLPVTPFMLDTESRRAPSEFEIHFVIDDVRYQYGIVVDAQRVHEEWLYAFPRGRAQKWFVREPTADGERITIEFGEKLRGEKELWERITRPNGTLLATAAQLNSEQLTPIFQWFAQKLKIAVGHESWNGTPFATLNLREHQQQDRILAFMQAADFAIAGLDIREVDASSLNTVPQDLPAQLKEMLEDQISNSKGIQIRTLHKIASGDTVPLDFSQESDGTQKMFCYAGPWLDTLANGNIMVVDELHDNLHPLLVQYLVAMFHNPDLNRHGAQLIFSTHETAILSQDLFRRDQIWFCERDDDQSTRLYPLSDFAVRKGTENIERGYLTGRYGALPFVDESRMPFGRVADGS